MVVEAQMVARSSSLQQQQQAHAAAGEQGGGGLLSSCAATRLKAVRELKNQLIGNKFKKLQHLHLVPLLLELVAGSASSSNSTTSDDSATNAAELQVQAISTLGSLAYGVEDGVRAIVAANGVQAIVSALGASDQRVVVAAARSLKLVYQSPLAPHEPLLAEATLQRLVALIQETTQSQSSTIPLQHQQQGSGGGVGGAAVATAAASVLAHCCTNREEAAKIVAVGAVPALVPLLSATSRSCQEAALEALAAITEHNSAACKELLTLAPTTTPAQQQQQQAAHTAVPPASPAAAAAAATPGGSKQASTTATATPSQLQQQQPALTAPSQESSSSGCGVVLQLLQLSKQRDAQLRCLVARCISHFNPAAAAAAGRGGGGASAAATAASDQQASPVNEELLHAARVVLPQLVRLLPAAAATASQAAETLEFITKHTHHPHYPPFTAAGGLGTAAGVAAAAGAGSSGRVSMPGGSKGGGGGSGDAAGGGGVFDGVGSGGDQSFLLGVPRVMAQLMGEREEFVNLAVELDAVKQLMTILTKTSSAAAAAAAQANSSGGGSSSSCGGAAAAASGSGNSGGISSHPTAALAAAAAAKKARAAAAAAAATAAAAGILQLRAGSLQALGSLAVGSEAARQQMIDGRIVTMLVAALSEPDAGVRIGAANTLRGLSRSVRILRGTSLTPNLAPPLVALLQDSSNSDVQVAAAATACNLALDFSNVSASLVENGLPQALAALLTSMLPELRLRALWAYKNLAFGCGPQLQALLLRELSWGVFKQLLTGDDDGRVRAQAVGLLQNLCKGGDSIEQVLQWSDGQLVTLLEEQLDPAQYPMLTAAAASASTTPAQAAAALSAQPDSMELDAVRTILPGLLYTTSNICSGSEEHKAAVMASRVPQLLLQYIQLGATCLPASVAGAGDGGVGGGRGGAAMSPTAAGARGGGAAAQSPAAARIPFHSREAARIAAAAAGAGPAGEGAGGAVGASSSATALMLQQAVCKLALPAVWCVINLLWCQDMPEPGVAVGAVGGGNGSSRQGAQQQAAGGGGGAGGSSSGGQGGRGGSGSNSQQADAGGDVAMTAADATAGAEGADDAARAAVLARVGALKLLGFEAALRGLQAASSAVGAAAGAGAGLPAPATAQGVLGSPGRGGGSPTVAVALAVAGGFVPAVVGAGGGGQPSSDDVLDTQDLVERVQTALQQLLV